MVRATTADHHPPGACTARDTCSYCPSPALFNTYPCGPDLPVPVCGACADR